MTTTFTCPECRNIGKPYCSKCNAAHWATFSKWSSGDQPIDDLIRETQNTATAHYQVLEWIPYDEFEDIEHFADGGFGSVYKALWKAGPISNYYGTAKDGSFSHYYGSFWNVEKAKWNRLPNTAVAIKKLKTRTPNFFKEVKNSWEMNCEVIGSELISRMYGITQDPSSNDYAIVTKFYENGNLRQAISQTDCSISWCKIIRIFCQITVALFTMHRKEFIHRDFHSGNILIRTKSNHFLEAVISDFGMSLHPDSETSGSTTVYGVLPFVAPEVLHDQVYTTACDIYGFGMIMYEVLSGKPPFFERNCDGALAVDICTRGKRPEIPEYAPEPYVTLMKKCWDSDRTKRPDAGTLSDEFNKWFRILMKVDDDSEGIYQAFTSSEEKWKTQLQVSQSRENLHSLYTSKSIVNTREFLINTTDSSENYDIQSTAIQYKY